MSFVDLDEFLQPLDTEIGKSHDAIVAEVINLDQPILLIHVYGDVPQPILGVEETWAVWSAVRSSAQTRRGRRGGVDGQAGGEVRLGRGAVV